MFRLDALERRLVRGEDVVPLTPKAFDMLLLLLERRGELVTKDDLMRALWPDSHVADANLTQTVFMLRKALGETASEQRYIFTVPGRGYRFAAEVKAPPVPVEQSAGAFAPAAEPALPPQAVLPNRHRSRRWVAAAVAAALIVAISLFLFGRRSQPRKTPGVTTMAVLPFVNLTGDVTQDYFSEGLREELTVQLERLDPKHLEVLASIPRAGAKSDANVNLKQVSRESGVDYLVEGSVRRDGSQLRASAKLIRTRDQTYVWARQYDRELNNLLAVESEIARDIATQILSTLGPQTQLAAASGTKAPNFETYDLYLKGRYFWNKRTPQTLPQAIAYFTQATERDPQYARAFAGLADAYALYNGYTLDPAEKWMTKARAAATRALALDPDLAEAHTSLAVIAQNYDYDWKTAEREYRRAIELDPNYATAHHWYGEFLALQGRFDEAFTEFERARRLDPLSLIMAADNGVALYYARKYEQSIQQFRSVVEMESNFGRADMIVYAYTQLKRYAEALQYVDKCCGQENTVRNWAQRAYIYGRAGDAGRAREAYRKLQALYAQNPVDPSGLLWAATGLGDHEAALSALERVYAARSSNLTSLKVNPMYDDLRGEPRFQDVLRRMGLAE